MTRDKKKKDGEAKTTSKATSDDSSTGASSMHKKKDGEAKSTSKATTDDSSTGASSMHKKKDGEAKTTSKATSVDSSTGASSMHKKGKHEKGTTEPIPLQEQPNESERGSGTSAEYTPKSKDKDGNAPEDEPLLEKTDVRDQRSDTLDEFHEQSKGKDEKSTPEVKSSPEKAKGRKKGSYFTEGVNQKRKNSDGVPSQNLQTKSPKMDNVKKDSQVSPYRGFGSSLKNIRPNYGEWSSHNFYTTDGTVTIRGLPNLGNSCYMATAVQLLSAGGALEDPTLPASYVLKILRQFYAAKAKKSTWTDTAYSISRQLPNFTPKRQEDAVDLLRAVYMSDSECPVLDKFFFMHTQETLLCDECSFETPCGENKVPEISVYPKCGELRLTMQARVNSYLKWKPIEGGRCENCCKVGKLRILTDVKVAPEVITIRICRWSKSSPKKNFYQILVDDEMVVDEFPYTLFGVALHQGESVKGGHYICEKRIGDKWFRCNDNTVRELERYRDTDNTRVCGAVYKKTMQEAERTTKPTQPPPKAKQETSGTRLDDMANTQNDASTCLNKHTIVTSSSCAAISPNSPKKSTEQGLNSEMDKLSLQTRDNKLDRNTISQPSDKERQDRHRSKAAANTEHDLKISFPLDSEHVMQHVRLLADLLHSSGILAHDELQKSSELQLMHYWLSNETDFDTRQHVYKSFTALLGEKTDVLDILEMLYTTKSCEIPERYFYFRTKGTAVCQDCKWNKPIGEYLFTYLTIDSSREKRDRSLKQLVVALFCFGQFFEVVCRNCFSSKTTKEGNVYIQHKIIQAPEIMIVRLDEVDTSRMDISEDIRILKYEYRLFGVLVKYGDTCSCLHSNSTPTLNNALCNDEIKRNICAAFYRRNGTTDHEHEEHGKPFDVQNLSDSPTELPNVRFWNFLGNFPTYFCSFINWVLPSTNEDHENPSRLDEEC